MEIRSRDLRLILDVVDPISSATTLGDLHGAIRHGLTRLIPAESCDLVICGEDVGAEETFCATPGTYTPDEITYMLAHAGDHPVARAYDAGTTGALRISQFASDRNWRRSPLFNEGGYRRLGFFREMAIDLPGLSGTGLAAISILRQRLDFTSRDADVLELLRPVMFRSWQRVRQRARPCSPERLRGFFPSLSAREAEVLLWIVEGKLNAEIVDLLQIRLGTVQEHVENILRKLHLENRHQLTVHVLDTLHRGS